MCRRKRRRVRKSEGKSVQYMDGLRAESYHILPHGHGGMTDAKFTRQDVICAALLTFLRCAVWDTQIKL